MIFYLVRHGKPDYVTDTLLPEGVEQAKKCAVRMKISGVDKIYSSTMGRAMQTAAPTAEAVGLPVIPCDWARELDKACHTKFFYQDGKRGLISRVPTEYFHTRDYERLTIEEDFELVPGLNDSEIGERYKTVADGLDGMLRENGYSRNADGFYDVIEGNDKHIALFAHAGMGRVVISHLLHIPFRYLCTTMINNFTGITAFTFENNELKVVSPRMISYGDIGHLYTDGTPEISFFTKEII